MKRNGEWRRDATITLESFEVFHMLWQHLNLSTKLLRYKGNRSIESYLDRYCSNHQNDIQHPVQHPVVSKGGIVFPYCGHILDGGNLRDVAHERHISDVDNMAKTSGDR